jgi:hypothetical protein
MTGGGNKPYYVWAPYPSTPSLYQFTEGKRDLERPSIGDYVGGYEPIKDHDPH